MVLSKPDDAPVQKLFDLTGKVVAITGKRNLPVKIYLVDSS